MNVTSAGPARPISVQRVKRPQAIGNGFANPSNAPNSRAAVQVLPLLAPLLFEQDERGGKLLLWLCVPGDEQFSFRQALAVLEAALAISPSSVTYSLPPESPMEDFVHGQFSWEGRAFALYYERSFGYLQFSSPSTPDVQRLGTSLRSATQPILPGRPNQLTKRGVGLVLLGLVLFAAPFLFLYLRP